MDKLVYGPDVVYHPVGDIPLQRGGTPPNLAADLRPGSPSK